MKQLTGHRDQPRRQRRLHRLRRGRRRDRLRLHRRRPPLLHPARARAISRDRHRGRLPALCAATRRFSTFASATRTTTSCAPRASRTSCARRARSSRRRSCSRPQRAARHLHGVHDVRHQRRRAAARAAEDVCRGAATRRSARSTSRPSSARLCDRRRGGDPGGRGAVPRTAAARRALGPAVNRPTARTSRRTAMRTKPGGDDKPDDKPEQDFVGPPMDDSTAMGEQYRRQGRQGEEERRRSLRRVPRLLPDASRAGIVDQRRLACVQHRRSGRRRLLRLQARPSTFPARLPATGCRASTTASRGPTGIDAPILDNPSETRDDRRSRLPALLRRRPPPARRLQDKRARPTGSNNSLSQSLEEGQMLAIATSMREFGAK